VEISILLFVCLFVYLPNYILFFVFSSMVSPLMTITRGENHTGWTIKGHRVKYLTLAILYIIL
jgi:hypothetical protein